MLEILVIKIQSLKNVTFCGHIASICSRRCPARILAVDPSATTSSRPMSGTGLRRAGIGRCYLPGDVGWWGGSPLLTRFFFGGGRVGQWRCRGFRTPRRWYVTVSARRTSTSVATWLHWRACSTIPGRFFRDLTGAMILWWFLLFGCPPPASIPVGRYGSSCISDAILVIIFDDVRTPRDDVLLLIIIECMLIWILYFILWFGFAYFMIWFCLLNAHIG